MIKKKSIMLATTAWLLLALVACSGQADATLENQTQGADQQTAVTAVEESAADTLVTATEALPAATAAQSEDEASPAATAVQSEDAAPAVESEGQAASSVAGAVAANDAQNINDPVSESAAQAAATQITLGGDTITVEGEGVQVDGRMATITNAGSYSLSGSLSEGQIMVDVEDEETVYLILNGIEISNTSTAPIFIAGASETVIELTAGSENYVTDGDTYVFPDPEEDEPNAAVFSKDDLTIYGEGTLIVNANYNDGIASKDGLVIDGGTLVVNAIDDGIRGKDYLVIKDGAVQLAVGGDGLKSDEDGDEAKGYILIESGQFDITSGNDAMQAETDVLISGGEFNIISGGSSGAYIDEDTSAKGIKGGVNVIIDAGTFTIDSADDAVHSNENMVINDGAFLVATGDDGFHADATLEFNGGVVQITKSFEGIESAVVIINDGDFNIVSSDDGINVAGGVDGSGFGQGPGRGRPPGGGGGPAGPGQDVFDYTGDYYLYINGGYIVIDARGDGIDINGATEMTDGVLIVNGPTEQMNGAIDVDATFTITGGFMVAAGSSGMAQTATSTSTQNALLMNFNGTIPAGTLIHVQDSSGNGILTFAPVVAYQSIAFSSPEIVIGETYSVYYDGTATGTEADGLYVDATYTPGTELGSFAVTDTITLIGSSGRR